MSEVHALNVLRRRQQGHGRDPRLFARFLQEVGVGLRLRESLSQQGFSVVAGASHEIRSLKPRS